MNKLTAIIDSIKAKRKILISLFLTLGIFSALVDTLILAQRPQTYRSKAAGQSPDDLQNIMEFTSPKTFYKLTFDKRYWTTQKLATKVIFNLNREYGFARLDIIEGESGKDLTSLTQDLIKSSSSAPIKVEEVQFKGKSAQSLTYREQVLDQDVYFEKLIFKEGTRFVILEKRVPKLGYNQSFLDNLLQNLSFNSLETAGGIKGISSFLTDLTTVELVDLVRPSVVSIVYTYCLDIVNLEPKLSLLSQSKYQFCSASKGSGFIINEIGVVATNGHVVKVFPEEGLVSNLLNQGSKDFTADLIKGVYLAKGQTANASQVEQFYQEMNLNPQYLDRFLTEIFDLISKKIISVSTSNEKYYINVGNEPVLVDYQKIQSGDYTKAVIPSSTTYAAKLVGFDYSNKYSYQAIVNKNYERGADVALLQIENSTAHFPVLELGSIENLRAGSDIIIAGYPTLVEGEQDPRAAISYKTSTKPTITKGIISAFKQDLTGKIVIQTDASIDHGNSGGPAFNSSGQVIGIATFMNESKTGNFNFLRDIAEIKELMTKNKIKNKLGDISKMWREGLNNFNNQYYQKAIKDFNQVKSLSKSHPTVDEFINLSKEAIQKGESLEGLMGFIRGKNSNILLLVFGGISGMSFMMVGFLTALPFFVKEETDDRI